MPNVPAVEKESVASLFQVDCRREVLHELTGAVSVLLVHESTPYGLTASYPEQDAG